MIWQKVNTTYISGQQEREQSVASIRYGTFKQYIAAQQQYIWVFRHTLCSVKFQDLVDAIKGGRAIAISDRSHNNRDRSHKNRWGIASWKIMADTNNAEQWSGLHVTPAGLHVTPGIKDDQFAFRSEIGGVYAMAVASELICKFFHISNGSVYFGSDCQVALYYIFDRNKNATCHRNNRLIRSDNGNKKSPGSTPYKLLAPSCPSTPIYFKGGNGYMMERK
jgi:hypothetical protein